jgi:hypothetical protein
MTQEQFTELLLATVDAKACEIIAAKAENQKFLVYVDAQTMSASIQNMFLNKLNLVPKQIRATCALCEAILAPSMSEKRRLLKGVLGIAGTTGGIAMIITGIGIALGWGAGVIATVIAFFAGGAFLGPIAWIAGGVAIAGIAAYFAFTGDAAKNHERYLKALKSGLKEGMGSVWEEFGDKLATAG